jgi:hypothetical protein
VATRYVSTIYRPHMKAWFYRTREYRRTDRQSAAESGPLAGRSRSAARSRAGAAECGGNLGRLGRGSSGCYLSARTGGDGASLPRSKRDCRCDQVGRALYRPHNELSSARAAGTRHARQRRRNAGRAGVGRHGRRADAGSSSHGGRGAGRLRTRASAARCGCQACPLYCPDRHRVDCQNHAQQRELYPRPRHGRRLDDWRQGGDRRRSSTCSTRRRSDR